MVIGCIGARLVVLLLCIFKCQVDGVVENLTRGRIGVSLRLASIAPFRVDTVDEPAVDDRIEVREVLRQGELVV